MKEKILYIATSLDGYIAGKDDRLDWLDNVEHELNYNHFFNSIDVIIMGYRTYDVIRKISDKWPYESKTTYVITTKRIGDRGNIKFISGDIDSIIKNIETSTNGKIWICGGSNIIKQLLEKDLIDKFIIYVFPILLGDGVKLFDTLSKEKKLKLLSSNKCGQVVELIYTK